MNVMVSEKTFTQALGKTSAKASKGGVDDPVFEIIARHRHAFRAWNGTLEKIDTAESKFKRETGAMSPEVVCIVCEPGFYFSLGGSMPEDLLVNAKRIPPTTVSKVARSHKEIEEILNDDPKQAKRIHAEFDRRAALYEAKVGPLKTLEEVRSDEARRAALQLFKTLPTSLAGLMALFRYAEETDKKGCGIWEDVDDAWRFLNLIERSVCALTGESVSLLPETRRRKTALRAST